MNPLKPGWQQTSNRLPIQKISSPEGVHLNYSPRAQAKVARGMNDCSGTTELQELSSEYHLVVWLSWVGDRLCSSPDRWGFPSKYRGKGPVTRRPLPATARTIHYVRDAAKSLTRRTPRLLVWLRLKHAQRRLQLTGGSIRHSSIVNSRVLDFLY